MMTCLVFSLEIMEDDTLEKTLKWLKYLSRGKVVAGFHELGFHTSHGLQIIHAKKGHILCKFTIPTNLSDKDGNWHVGAMAILIDDIGAAAVYSAAGNIKASLDFNVSYLSTVKIQEEVEIEAKVVGPKEKLAMVVVEVRRKEDGKLIALAKQWMASIGLTPNQVSKL